jgi:hypothetical protein
MRLRRCGRGILRPLPAGDRWVVASDGPQGSAAEESPGSQGEVLVNDQSR